MKIHDGIYEWEGWGGIMRLGSGKCRLRIYDLDKDRTDPKSPKHLKPIIVIVSDVPESRMAIRSCSGHIATSVTRDFRIDYHRMVWVEYYPTKTYGVNNTHTIPERLESVEFAWHEDKAIQPKYKPLNPLMRKLVKDLLED